MMFFGNVLADNNLFEIDYRNLDTEMCQWVVGCGSPHAFAAQTELKICLDRNGSQNIWHCFYGLTSS